MGGQRSRVVGYRCGSQGSGGAWASRDGVVGSRGGGVKDWGGQRGGGGQGGGGVMGDGEGQGMEWWGQGWWELRGGVVGV